MSSLVSARCCQSLYYSSRNCGGLANLATSHGPLPDNIHIILYDNLNLIFRTIFTLTCRSVHSTCGHCEARWNRASMFTRSSGVVSNWDTVSVSPHCYLSVMSLNYWMDTPVVQHSNHHAVPCPAATWFRSILNYEPEARQLWNRCAIWPPQGLTIAKVLIRPPHPHHDPETEKSQTMVLWCPRLRNPSWSASVF